MASIQQVRTRLATAHTALQAAASLMDALTYQENSSEFEYMERELHKILGRLEALDAGLVHKIPPKDHSKGSFTGTSKGSYQGDFDDAAAARVPDRTALMLQYAARAASEDK